MDFIEAFSGVLVALIVKDFYDIFIRDNVKKVFSNYKITLMPKNGIKKVKKNE